MYRKNVVQQWNSIAHREKICGNNRGERGQNHPIERPLLAQFAIIEDAENPGEGDQEEREQQGPSVDSVDV